MRYIAFYLPQYHPIPENDEWWGVGFTEWRNVVKARPRFSEHYQPHLPADIGFYDLRLPEVRRMQAAMALANGLSGFCYYHYWFNGKLVLERPLEEVLSSNEPDFPFCVCWANENWTRAWDGLTRDVLLKQTYDLDDAEKHALYLGDFMSDSRYITIDGKPVIIIYRPDSIPDPKVYFDVWRDTLSNAFGIKDIYIIGVQSGLVKFNDEEIIDAGYDAVLDFQPNREDFPTPSTAMRHAVESARKCLPDGVFQKIKSVVKIENIIDYKKMVYEKLIQREWPLNYIRMPVVFPSWDNTARRDSPTVIQNLDASIFLDWLNAAKNQVDSYPDEEKVVFINAWNEWAEGCHLEPDLKNGKMFLEALKKSSICDPLR